MNKHTTGPWRFIDNSDRHEISAYIVESCNLAADGLNSNAGAIVKLKKKSYHDNKANAMLIAAAPELLSALSYMIECVESAINAGDWIVDGACDPSLAIECAKEIINKATGKQT